MNGRMLKWIIGALISVFLGGVVADRTLVWQALGQKADSGTIMELKKDLASDFQDIKNRISEENNRTRNDIDKLEELILNYIKEVRLNKR